MAAVGPLVPFFGLWPFLEGLWLFLGAKGLKLPDIEIPPLHYMLFDTQVIVAKFSKNLCILGKRGLVLVWFKTFLKP